MPDIFICTEAEADLDSIYDHDEDAAALIDALLIEFDGEDALLEMLCQPTRQYRHAPPFEVKRFAAMWDRGRNVFILKIHSIEGQLLPYRVIYGFNAQRNSYHVLAIPNREIAYDENDQLFKAILARYERAGIPNYG